MVSCLLVCTDGVWDNWKYNDIIEASMTADMIDGAIGTEDGQSSCAKLMEANKTLAVQHFGNQADNMTAILVYIVEA